MTALRRFIHLLAVVVVCLTLAYSAAPAGAKKKTDESGQSQSQSAQDQHAPDTDQAPGQAIAPAQTGEAPPANEDAGDPSANANAAAGGESGNSAAAGEGTQTAAAAKSNQSDTSNNSGGKGNSAAAQAAHKPPTVSGDVPRPPKQIVDDDGDPSTDGYYAGEAIVRLHHGADIGAFGARHGTGLIAAIPAHDLYLLRLPADRDSVAVERELAADPDAVWAELNYAAGAPEGRPGYFFTSRGEADAPAAPYGPALVGAPQAQRCTTGAGVVVAILDTGVDPRSPLLQARVLPGWNALASSADTRDAGNGRDDNGNGYVDELTGHGTHVAGIVAQIAPDAAILPVTVLNSDGVGDAFFLAAGIYYAVDSGAQVINLSLGSTYDAHVIEEAVAAANGAGAVVVAAAGNSDRAQPVEYPAANRGAVAVAATDEADRKSAFSNYGKLVKISAPGTRITSAFAGGGEATWSGTSMAAPFVAGAAALLFAEHPDWSRTKVIARLRATARDLDVLNPDYVHQLGTGRLDVAAAADCR
jgi:subtilisin family serine protease